MKRHVLHLGKIAFSCSLIIGLFGLILFKDNVAAGGLDSYKANYEIKSARDKILGTFVEIDANDKVGNSITPQKFNELSVSFKTLFPRFPQDYAYKVVYEQCNLLTTQLSTISTSDTRYRSYFSSFMNNCYKPLTDILQQINSKYMVIPSASVSPSSGPAPLTVTFDARASKDPSNETIPSSNFYRYYRDTNGQDQIIGNSPVLHYTFQKEGNYLVHLTVKSSNTLAKGILDGDDTISVDVTPKSALIALYANGQKMDKEHKSKVGTLEAQKGVILDGSSTIAMGGRQLMTYHWEITSKDGFSFIKDGDGRPDLLRVSLPQKGEYKVHLEVLDNENNKTSEDYTLVVSDPVAIIKASPDKGNTSVTYNFDGTPSYSVLSSLKLYTWEIYDQNGNKVETYQGKSIKQQFKTPGFYVVKLTVEDDLGETNTDNIQIYVDSTEPIPQFTVTAADQWKYPSRFNLDASVTTDIDKSNGVDSLSYEWTFPEEAKVKVVASDPTNSKITAEFNAIGKFSCKLTVKDQYGKLSEITKDIEVKSILRPEITATPQASTWNTPIGFTVKSNMQIAMYNWDFGDADTRSIQVDSISHIYKTTNVYKVKLSVDDGNGMTNEISKNIFIGEKSYPIAGYEISDKSSKTLTQNETCPSNGSGQSGLTIPAYQVDRFSNITINPSISVNTKGGSADLQFYFQPQNKEIYKQSTFNYKFDEVGCHYIDLTAEDTSINKNNTTRIWFKVVNSLPNLDNLDMIFPQYGNEVGIGFNENQTRDVFTTNFDPLIVKITATNPVDADGFIAYYKWYYFPKDDPTRYIETKITPGNIPYVFFSLPRVAGEYGFGVTMYDNDGGKKSSQEIIGNGPIVIFPPDASQPDIPLVTVKVNQSAVEVGDEVTFNVISKVISDRPDFVKERTIYYDFDGDDKWDLITKKDRVTYTYPKASDAQGFKPKVQVLYRGFNGVSYGEKIIVKDGLKPRLLYSSYGNFAIFRDVSLGPITTRTLCLNKKNCTPETTITGTAVSAFSTTYDSPGKYFASLTIGDDYANEVKKIIPVTINNNTSGFSLLSIPEATTTDDKTEIIVGNNLDNTVLFYMKTDKPENCFVDADIGEDSDGDGITDNDHDFACNTLYLKKYTPKYETTIGRISYIDQNNQTKTQEFTISFLDYEMQLDPQYKVVYNQITTLIKSISGTGEFASGDIQLRVRDMLKDLKNNIGDESARMASVVSLKDYLNKNPIVWTPDQNTLFQNIFLALATKETIAAAGGSSYEVLKADILAILPGDLLTQTNALFTQFENIKGDAAAQTSQQENRKAILQQIVALIAGNVAADETAIKDNQITKNDMDTIIMPDICSIMEIYSIPSSFCSTASVKAVPDNIAVEQGTTATPVKTKTSALQIVFWVLGSFITIFIILVVIFAVRAKMRQEKDENEGIPTPPTQ